MSRRASRVLTIDPGRPAAPEGLASPREGHGEVVALVADASAREAGWTGALAIDLAETWGTGETPVILADGDVTASQLHELVGTPNVEGVSDLVRYGASTERVARPVGSRSFRFIPKGTIVPDPESVYLEARWSDWFDHMRDSGVVLVLCLPAGIDGVSGLSEKADRVVLLAGDEMDPPEDDRVVLVHAEAATTTAESSEASEVVPAPKPLRGAGELASAGSTKSAKRSSRPKETGFGKILLLAFLVVILVIVVAVSLGLISIPGITVGLSPG